MTDTLSEHLVRDGSLWLPSGASTVAGNVDGLFNFILWGTGIFFVVIMAIMVLFVVKYRRTAQNQKASAQITHNTKLEIFWTTLPLILVMIVFGWGFRDYMKMTVPPANAMEIRITGRQWFWQFDYPRQGVTTIGEFTVPVNQPVKLILSSGDVLHSFYLPGFRIKRDVLPNRYTTTWFEATQTGPRQVFCAEYCGDSHSGMLAHLNVVSASEFQEWLVKANLIPDSIPLVKVGEIVFNRKACTTCHSLDGSVKTGPTWKGLYGREELLTDGRKVLVDDNYIRESVMDPKAKVAAGFQPVMPTFKGLLKDREIDGLIEFIKQQH